MNKGIWVGLVAIAFVAGSITTGTMAFAAPGGQGNDAIVQALQNIANAISRINPTVNNQVTVPEDSITVQVEGLKGETGDKGPTGDQGPPGEQGPPGDPGSAVIPAGSLGVDKLATLLPTVTGSVTLTQPEFNVAGFNQIIASVNLGSVSGPAAATFEPIILVSVKPRNAPADAAGFFPVPYNGDISHEVVTTYSTPGGVPTINYNLWFRLETQPLPPQSDGSPAIGDLAPAGSQVVVDYKAVFAKLQTP